jgi:predicted acyl esterase
MKKIILSLSAAMLSFWAAAQNNNGQLDMLEELATKTTVNIPMPDGTTLAADIFLPITSDSLMVTFNLLGQNLSLEFIPKNTQLVVYPDYIDVFGNPFPNPNPYQLPFLVTRTPYDRQGIGAAGGGLTLLGYAYVSEDTRGRFGSQGAYLPLYSDSWQKTPYNNYNHVLDISAPGAPQNSRNHEDGIHSIDYYLSQYTRVFDLNGDGTPETTAPACNGTIGLAGASAFAMPHLQLAAARKINPNQAGIKGMITAIGTGEHYLCSGFHNGVARQSLMHGFLAGQWDDLNEDSVSVDNSTFNNLHTPADYGQLTNQAVFDLSIDHFQTLDYGTGFTGAYPNSSGRAQMDISAAPVDANGVGVANGQFSRYSNMNTPNYNLTGWYDVFINGQLETFRKTRAALTGDNAQRQKIVIGPWTHLALAGQNVGDVRYPANVGDVLGITTDGVNPNDLASLNVAQLLQLEPFSFLRYALNTNGHVKLGEPVIRIPRSTRWQQPTANIQVRIPAEDYDVSLASFVNFIAGQGTLPAIAADVNFGLGPTRINVPIPAIPSALPIQLPEPIQEPVPVDFEAVPDIRFYVMAATDTAGNSFGFGNYWFASDVFPLDPSQVVWTNFYLHGNATLDGQAPTTDEGTRSYTHDPNNPIITHGGNNMYIDLPDGSRRTEGQMNYADPTMSPLTMNNDGVIAFTSAAFGDTMSVIGYPKATIYAASQPNGAVSGDTDTDFFVRILDVCPDGRELFVVEGAVNARAREYARTIYNGSENVNIPFSNIAVNQFYEYQFELLPIAYTFGAGHQMKVLISSSNYPKYQANPNLPIEAGEFFRRQPNDGRTYNYLGQNMSPRTADNSVAFAPSRPSRIELPIFNGTLISVREQTIEPTVSFNIAPNPAKYAITIAVTDAIDADVFIYDALGRVVAQTKMQNTNNINVDIANLPAAAYTVQLRDADGKTSKAAAFVKE